MMVYNLLILGLLLCEYKKSKMNTVIFLVLSSVAMILVVFMRADTVGIDYKQYAAYFYQVHGRVELLNQLGERLLHRTGIQLAELRRFPVYARCTYFQAGCRGHVNYLGSGSSVPRFADSVDRHF